MGNHETQPLEPKKITSPLDESHVTPRETILNAVIDEYLAKRKGEGHEVFDQPSNEDISAILKTYSDEHGGLTGEEGQHIRKTIETIFPIRIARNKKT